MHRTAHVLFGMGMASLLPYFFASPFVLILCTFFGGIMASLPDLDIRMGMKHRNWKGTHGLRFIIVGSLITTIILMFINYVILKFFPNFGGIVVSEGSINLSESLIPIVIYFGSISLAIISHLLIDVLTHSGLDLGFHHLSGSIKSSNPIANFVFASIGLIISIITISSSFLVDYFGYISPRAFNFILLILMVISFVIIFGSLIIGKRRRISHLYCGKIQGISMCSVDKDCVNIDGKKKCFTRESSHPK